VRRALAITAAALVVLGVLLVVNALVMDRETKAASPTIGRIVDLPNGDVQVREDGPRSAQPIVLLHCFACSMRWWDRIVPALAKDHHVVRIDLLGHGGSEMPRDGYSMQDQAERVEAVIRSLRLPPAVVVGHSMGGAVATALAEQRPDVMSGLVIIDTPPDPKDAELPFAARIGFVPVIGEATKRIATDGMVKKGLEDAFAPGYDVPDQFVDDFNRMTYSAYDGSHNGATDFGDERPLDARLADVGKPLLVIFGARDQIVDPDSAAGYKRVKGARVTMIPNAGHSPNVETPVRTADLIDRFAQRLNARRANARR
jgi:pimeloyl-ACP methyl ester carboxylesterase